MLNIKWINTEPDICSAAAELIDEMDFPEEAGNTALTLSICRGEFLSLKRNGSSVYITYTRKNECFRALSYLPRILSDGNDIIEEARYEELCYMVDASRNAVPNIDCARRLIHYLALMGYTSLMLYAEDTYEIPEYPHFGYMRGRYSAAELKEIDCICARFGLEFIPCIQTLAHLTTALRWPEFNNIRDTDDILMIGDERSYDFIEAAIRQCAECFSSRRIHIGMDEAHMVGCGEYLRKNGYNIPSELMIQHLNRVVGICEKYGFSPMIWSDMFFRMSFNGEYRVSEGYVPREVTERIPHQIALVYWDYYSENPGLISHMLECHKRFGNPVIFAGGAWKWLGFGAHNRYSMKFAAIQLDECEKHGVGRVIVTSWGDNGAEASQFAGMASALFYAERCYGVRDERSIDLRCRLCFKCTLDELLAFDLPDMLPELGAEKVRFPKNPSKYLLYNDLLEGLFDLHVNPKTAPDSFAEHSRMLLDLADNTEFGYAFETLGRLCGILAYKCDMGWRLRKAYHDDDRDVLYDVANEEIPKLGRDLEDFLSCLERQWMRENKPFGMIAQEMRIGGMIERVGAVRRRINDYLEGNTSSIPELEEELLPINVSTPRELKFPYISFNNWIKNVSTGIV